MRLTLAWEKRLGEGAEAVESLLRKPRLALGRQYKLERRIRSGASVSTALFQTALLLAQGRGLLGPDPADRPGRRAAFAEEIQQTLKRLDFIEGLDGFRHAEPATLDARPGT